PPIGRVVAKLLANLFEAFVSGDGAFEDLGIAADIRVEQQAYGWLGRLGSGRGQRNDRESHDQSAPAETEVAEAHQRGRSSVPSVTSYCLPPRPPGSTLGFAVGFATGCGFFTYLSSHAAQRAQRSSNVSRAAGPWSS